jgi:phospholipase A1
MHQGFTPVIPEPQFPLHKTGAKALSARKKLLPLLVALALLASGKVLAQEKPVAPETLSDCAGIVDNILRLACFDRLAAVNIVPPPGPAQVPGSLAGPHSGSQANSTDLGSGLTVSPADTPVLDAAAEIPTESLLARHWETEARYKNGRYRFRPHNDNYLLLAKYANSPNDTPFTPYSSAADGEQILDNTELEFQVGFKMKVLETIAKTPVDLWFGYTQQSFWQAYSKHASSPFRETNYQPEVMLVAPLDFKLLGLRARFANIGFVHQSNGQSLTLSRSWNRLYLQTGWERGNFSLLTRVWTRTDEDDFPDDNPDILDYMGHGDIMATWRKDGHQLSMMARRNFDTGRGAVQLGWAFPVVSRLKGYVQVFSGYGQSLIDYNSYQNTVGVGVLLDY